jgi:hypothetical protein
MKKLLLTATTLLTAHYLMSQNVGIGTTTPGFPLNFSNTLGDKISLYGNTGNHYGFGIQGGLLQMYSDAAAANISFGYGSSAAFTERMQIINSGGDGLSLNGRITLKNGTNPLDINYGSGVWMYKADNSALLGFMGVQNNQNLGFYGGPGGWGFTYDAINSRVGIGNNNPNAPLAFPAALGKKITLYPGATGDVGFAVAGNRLQIYSDNPNADVAIGYDAAGTFIERFAFKPNGALAINGSTGSPGQVLKTNGSGAAVSWIGRPYAVSFSQSGNSPNFQLGDLFVPIPGLDNQSFSITETSNVVFNANILVYDPSPISTAYVYTEVQFLNVSAQVVGTARAYGEIAPLRKNNVNVTGTATLTPGFYTTRVVLGKDATLDAPGTVRSEGDGKLILEIFPN